MGWDDNNDNDNNIEPLKAGVTQSHERHSLKWNCVTPTESGSLSNTTTKYVLTFMHAEFNYVIYVLS